MLVAAGLAAELWLGSPTVTSLSLTEAQSIWTTPPTRRCTLATAAVLEANNSVANMLNADGLHVRASGRLLVPATGVYTLAVLSDDSAVLLLNDVVLVDNDPPCNASTAPCNTGVGALANVTAGYHNITILYYHRRGTALLNVMWESAGLGLARTTIPPGACSHRAQRHDGMWSVREGQVW